MPARIFGLIDAAKQTKIIDKLRDRQLAEWQAVAARKETADLDEVATQMSTMTMRDRWSNEAQQDPPPHLEG